MKTELNQKLPNGILKSDLKYATFEETKELDWEDRSFELWNVKGIGWVIPTLSIRKNRRNDYGDRTYAIGVSDKKIYTCGFGPHVLERITVWVRDSRLNSLQMYLDLRREGMEKAGMIRDRMSTRRANTIMRRTLLNSYLY